MPLQKESTASRSLFAEERHLQILQLLQEKTKLHVAELCEQFSVSPATIRNDLRDLEAAGRLKRTHGGAIPLEKTAFEPNSHAKAVANRAIKQRLAAHAATLIEDNDTIALDSGTTMMELAQCLTHHKALTVLTNDVHIAVYLERNPQITVVLIGGVLRHGFGCTTGPIVAVILQCGQGISGGQRVLHRKGVHHARYPAGRNQEGAYPRRVRAHRGVRQLQVRPGKLCGVRQHQRNRPPDYRQERQPQARHLPARAK